MGCQSAVEDSASGRSLEKRLRALEDEREIRDLLVRYAVCLDRRNFTGYAELFAEDGRWFGRMGDVQGREAIGQMLLDSFGPTPAGFVNTSNFHLMTNFLVEVDGDTARADSRITYFARGENDRPVAMLAGRYEDAFVRRDGRWLFASRQVIGEIPTIAEAPVPTPEESGQ
jgi:uncharacterized protein (TIGR02246 family)